jgi:dihydrofolate reductase
MRGAVAILRKLVMWNVMTLDGFFEGRKSWEIDWHDYVWGEELERFSIEQSKSIGMLLFGRVTYEGMAGYWSKEKGEIADFMNRVPKIVFSRTLIKADWNNTRLVKGKPEEEVARLKEQPGKDLYIFGSANLASTLTRHGLIDEYRLGLAPVVLGGGNPLFKESPERLKLKLVEARPLKTGGVILRYMPEKAVAK